MTIDLTKRFQRRVEDFVCEHCGAPMKGDGYTNHCRLCLWSKHVDNKPGDRLHPCGGLMEPVALEKEGEGWKITQRCQKCGFERKNKSQVGDSFENLVALAKKLAQNRK